MQFGLFGGAILHLGTRRHHEQYLADVIAGRVLGCFAMTETGHGSNVQAVETTATYDPETDEFVIAHAARRSRARTTSATPPRTAISPSSSPSSSSTARATACTRSSCRSATGVGDRCPACTITDCGPKLGLKGVDNGRLEFDDVRVPRENLLNRYADVDRGR